MLSIMKRYLKNKHERCIFERNNKGVIIDETVKLKCAQYIHCGFKTVIGEGSRLLCWDSYNGVKFDKNPILQIGTRFHATRNLTIQCVNEVSIGDNVLVASDVLILDYNHGMNPEEAHYLDNPLEVSSGIKIEDGVWIGNNVIVLGGVTIGRKSIIGAGAVVTHDIPAYSVAVGNPAKVIKKYDTKTKQWISVE